ncbi:hypothetical protein SUNI508_02261 [Seiridium unicorne]|uniref:Uncharacterized protein n=1 Tax=Seiridium unicorne TaxID=138068 RepID=A0ABR2UI14_9PEZI
MDTEREGRNVVSTSISAILEMGSYAHRQWYVITYMLEDSSFSARSRNHASIYQPRTKGQARSIMHLMGSPQSDVSVSFPSRKAAPPIHGAPDRQEALRGVVPKIQRSIPADEKSGGDPNRHRVRIHAQGSKQVKRNSSVTSTRLAKSFAWKLWKGVILKMRFGRE